MKRQKRVKSRLKRIIILLLSIEVLLMIGGYTYLKLRPVGEENAPVIEVADQTVFLNETVDPRIFLVEPIDIVPGKASFREIPDTSKPGVQEVTIIFEDNGKNRVEKSAKLTVLDRKNSVPIKAGSEISSDSIATETSATDQKDTQAPEFQGVKDKTVTIGETISYKKGVTVTDNEDKELGFSVDSSKVNLKKEGSYPVVYTAKDSAGNLTTKTIYVIVKKFNASEDSVNELCDEILGEITKSSMTNREIAYAVYQWIKQHIGYSGDSDKSDWMAEAYRGMTNRSGDCFTYFAVAQALLTRAGIDNMEVTRVGGRTRHYWNLVNCGDGWYHFDSCPNKDHRESFLLTDKEVEEYTRLRGNNYYNFDKSLYPATPEE